MGIWASSLETAGGGNASGVSSGSFVNSDLTAGVLTIDHGLNLSTGIPVFAFADNNGVNIDVEVTRVDADSCTADLSAFGTLTGTWTYRMVG